MLNNFFGGKRTKRKMTRIKRKQSSDEMRGRKRKQKIRERVAEAKVEFQQKRFLQPFEPRLNVIIC